MEEIFFAWCVHILLKLLLHFVNASPTEGAKNARKLSHPKKTTAKVEKDILRCFFFLPVIQLVCGKRRSVSPECEWALGWEKCYSSVFMWRHHWELPFTLSQSAINCEPKIPSYCFTWGRSICRDVCHTKSIWISHWTRNHTWVTNFLFLILFDVSIQVSWIRKRDLHILTSENFVFSSDQRFTVLHQPDSEEWNLKIEYVTLKDDGTYECQINTEPKIKLSVLLEVTGEREKRKRKVCRKKYIF